MCVCVRARACIYIFFLIWEAKLDFDCSDEVLIYSSE